MVKRNSSQLSCWCMPDVQRISVAGLIQTSFHSINILEVSYTCFKVGARPEIWWYERQCVAQKLRSIQRAIVSYSRAWLQMKNSHQKTNNTNQVRIVPFSMQPAFQRYNWRIPDTSARFSHSSGRWKCAWSRYQETACSTVEYSFFSTNRKNLNGRKCSCLKLFS